MFDRYIIGNDYPQQVNASVTVNKSSTAEDACLLHDLEKQAEKNLVSRLTLDVGSNLLNGVVLHREADRLYAKEKFYFIFDLNGVDFKIPLEVDYFRVQSDEDLLKEVYEEFSKILAVEILKKTWMKNA